MCLEAGVQLIYLPPYSPDLNRIEEFFFDLKPYIKRKWNEYELNPNQGFDAFLEWCVDVVSSSVSSAEGHFRYVGPIIDEP